MYRFRLYVPHPLSKPDRFRFVLVILDYFIKYVELGPLRMASTKAVVDSLFANFIFIYLAQIQVAIDDVLSFTQTYLKLYVYSW